MIRFENVYKEYPGGNEALHDVDLHIKRGEFVFVLGPSGAGKSTFLKLILREESPTRGHVWVDGVDLADLKEKQIPYLRRKIGVVFQDFRLIPTMTVYDNVAFALRVTDVSEDRIRERVPIVLKLVGLTHKADAYPPTLSGGEQQRVAVGRALAHSPELLIADEPTGNVDPAMSLEMMKLLVAANNVGTTVVVVTHEQDMARRMGKRIILLEEGRVVTDGKPGQCKGGARR